MNAPFFFSFLAYISVNSLKMTNVGKIDWVLETAPNFGLREKKNPKKQPALNEFRADSGLKIIIFRYFAFFFSINFLFFCYLIIIIHLLFLFILVHDFFRYARAYRVHIKRDKENCP